MRAIRACLPLSLAAALFGCGEAGVYYDVKFSPGFSPGPTTVSVLGVYQDGRMSTELWHDVELKLAPVLGKNTCDAVWGEKLRAAEPDLFEEVDRTTQADGLTEDVLDRFSSAAEGDAILVVSLTILRGAGAPQRPTPLGAGLGGSGLNQGSQMPGSRGRAMPPPAPGAIRPGTWSGQEIRLAGILFSAKRHAAMGRVVLTYMGTNLEDALGKFVNKLAEEIPGSVCKGWKVEAPKPAF